MRRILSALVVVLALFWAAPSRAAIAFVASANEGSPDRRTVTTPTMDSTGADLLIAFVAYIESVGAFSLDPSTYFSDSKGNTWTWVNSGEIGSGTGSRGTRLAWSKPTSVGSGHTASVSNPGVDWYPSISIVAFSGSHASPYDISVGAQQADASTMSVGSINPAEDNELLIAAVVFGGTAIDSSYGTAGAPQIQEPGVASNACGHAVAWQIQTTDTTRNPQFSGGANFAASGHAAFKAAGDPPAESASRLLTLGVK